MSTVQDEVEHSLGAVIAGRIDDNCVLDVYNVKKREARRVYVQLNTKWGGSGVLGIVAR